MKYLERKIFTQKDYKQTINMRYWLLKSDYNVWTIDQQIKKVLEKQIGME